MRDRSTRPIVLAAIAASMAVGLMVTPFKLDLIHGVSFQPAFAENRAAYMLSLRERADAFPAQGDEAAVAAYRAMSNVAIKHPEFDAILADDAQTDASAEANMAYGSGQIQLNGKAAIK